MKSLQSNVFIQTKLAQVSKNHNFSNSSLSKSILSPSSIQLFKFGVAKKAFQSSEKQKSNRNSHTITIKDSSSERKSDLFDTLSPTYNHHIHEKSMSQSTEFISEEISLIKAKLVDKENHIKTLLEENTKLKESNFMLKKLCDKYTNDDYKFIKVKENGYQCEKCRNKKSTIMKYEHQVVFEKISKTTGLEMKFLMNDIIKEDDLKTSIEKLSNRSIYLQVHNKYTTIQENYTNLRENKTAEEKKTQICKWSNEELIRKVLSYADILYEKNLEIKSITEQKNQILNNLSLAQKEIKEFFELREYINYLLDLIRDLRKDMKNLAVKHNSHENIELKKTVPKEIIDNITSIARKAKMGMSDVVKKVILRMKNKNDE
ncbi:hypothetical protein SteCoe_18395 [Stentor coeruleus]|uniref:Uncharacterized protein n=1 Tax=Stentor coeruleus TaxID=5963 RepID=A0A1R2BWH9_9CILI|nr:hypothetical protein SteCoe_18395 [Stentor coeruleus]